MRRLRIISILFASLIIIALTKISAQTVETGKATYYADRMHGRPTSSGTRYHRDSFYCAHRTLPFGTLVRVTDTNTGKSVIVKVIDRGPFGKGKVVDLSKAAARELGMLSKGVIRIELEVVNDSISATLSESDKDNPEALDSIRIETIIPLDDTHSAD